MPLSSQVVCSQMNWTRVLDLKSVIVSFSLCWWWPQGEKIRATNWLHKTHTYRRSMRNPLNSYFFNLPVLFLNFLSTGLVMHINSVNLTVRCGMCLSPSYTSTFSIRSSICLVFRNVSGTAVFYGNHATSGPAVRYWATVDRFFSSRSEQIQ